MNKERFAIFTTSFVCFLVILVCIILIFAAGFFIGRATMAPKDTSGISSALQCDTGILINSI